MNVFIERTDSTPLVFLHPDEECKIEGKAIPEDPVTFFDPIFRWAESVSADRIMLNVNMVYFNTSVSKHLMEFFKKLEGNDQIQSISINWHYEEGDEEIQESGELYEELLERTDFNFVEYAEVL